MKRLLFYLLPLLLLDLACSQNKQKLLFPTKLIVGNTQYDFLYNPNSGNRIYSVTTTRPGFYSTFTYKYYDEHFRKSEHKWKDKIISMHYEPDRDVIGWDGRDSVIFKSSNIWKRNDLQILAESQHESVYKAATSKEATYRDRRKEYFYEVKHAYNSDNQLTGSTWHATYSTLERTDTVGVLARRVAYSYRQGKLAKAAFYAPDAAKPYLQIELAYDDKPGFLRNLPLEARFLPLELPYRDHNIVGYTVKDEQGNIRKDLSYTCTYTYNRDGYPDTFTRNMLDGRKVKGYLVYRTETRELPAVASAE